MSQDGSARSLPRTPAVDIFAADGLGAPWAVVAPAVPERRLYDADELHQPVVDLDAPRAAMLHARAELPWRLARSSL
jgi:hypothetical protein